MVAIGEALGGDAQRLAGGAPRLDGHRVVVLLGVQHLPLQRLRQLGLLRPHQLDHLAVGTLADREIVEAERRRPAAGRAAGSGSSPSLSIASKPNCRASGAIEARGLSSAEIR